ncbi:hypothetical protein, partial [Dokdonella sp.]|uniref:hypothetical protein n=1 Tax=Dokdonella sp. TaxID=2291710 RepID=UPI0039C8A803
MRLDASPCPRRRILAARKAAAPVARQAREEKHMSKGMNQKKQEKKKPAKTMKEKKAEKKEKKT